MSDNTKAPESLKVKDQSVRQQALNPKRSFIVQAPAGSGKTELLIQRYLGLLSAVEKPEEILALTFTRKAAAEMRERVLNALTDPNIASIVHDESLSEHKRKTLELAWAAQQQNLKLEWGLLHNPNRMQIMTIDSFCARLVQAMPVASRLGGMPELEENAEILYRRAIRKYFDSFLQNQQSDQSLETILLDLNNNFTHVEDLLVSMLSSRDQWLPYVSDEGYIEKDELDNALEAAAYQETSPLLQAIPIELEEELITLASYAAENLRVAFRESAIRDCQFMEQMPNAGMHELKKWKGLRELLLTKPGQLRKNVTVAQGFPAESSAEDPNLKGRYKEFKQRMVAFLKRLEEYPDFIKRLAVIDVLPNDIYQREDVRFLTALFEVLKQVSAELILEFKRSGKVDFIELTSSALRALGTGDDFTDLAVVFDARIDHILIDEFQDTSRLHVELLKKLTVGWSYDGRTLFVVGDPMQSIYRFREADVRNFLRVKQRGINAVLPEYLQLESNFRSARQIVAWTNQVFSKIFPKDDDLEMGKVSFMSSSPVNPASSYVPISLHVTPEKEDAFEARAVTKLIRELQEKDPDTSIAVLARSRRALAHILPVLREEGLVSTIDGMEELGQQQEVLDLYSLTMSLIHLADSYAWLSVLRAPWCGLDLADLEIIARHAKNGLVWDALQTDEVMQQVSAFGRERVAYFVHAFRYAHSMLYREPLAVVVEGLWLRLHGNSVLETMNQQVNVDNFFTLLQKFDVSTVLGSEYSLQHALSKYTGSTEGQSSNVQVMTIHMAKGLEFDHVIMPGMNRTTRRSDTPLLNWDEVSGLDGKKHLLLSHYQNQKDDHIYKYIRKRNQRQDDAESLRLLYVAFTRAINSIHVFCSAKVKDDSAIITSPVGSLYHWLKPVRSIMGEPKLFGFNTAEIPKLTLPSFVRQRLKHLPEPDFGVDINYPKAKDQVVTEYIKYEWASESAMHIGTVVHQALSQLGKGTLAQWMAIDDQQKRQHFARVLKALGIPRKELERSVTRTLETLMSAVNDEKGQWVLSSNHRQIENEYPISGFIDEEFRNFRIDRTFVSSDDVRWIIDYKTSDHSGSNLESFLDAEVERYQYQLNNYAKLISRTEKRQIKLGLYFPLMQSWREWDFKG